MKVMAISGSARSNGNTVILLKHVAGVLEKEGIETEIVQLGELDVRPCNACGACDGKEYCPIDDDFLPIYERMKQAEGIILACPVYNGSATALMKAFMERSSYISTRNGKVFAGKVGAPLVVARRAGQNFTLAQLLFWYFNQGFFIPGSTYWNIAFGRNIGEVDSDEEGIKTTLNFAKNMAFLLKKLNS